MIVCREIRGNALLSRCNMFHYQQNLVATITSKAMLPSSISYHMNESIYMATKIILGSVFTLAGILDVDVTTVFLVWRN